MTLTSAGWVWGGCGEGWATDEGVVKVKMLRRSRMRSARPHSFIFSLSELVLCWLEGHCGSTCVFMWCVRGAGVWGGVSDGCGEWDAGVQWAVLSICVWCVQMCMVYM